MSLYPLTQNWNKDNGESKQITLYLVKIPNCNSSQQGRGVSLPSPQLKIVVSKTVICYTFWVRWPYNTRLSWRAWFRLSQELFYQRLYASPSSGLDAKRETSNNRKIKFLVFAALPKLALINNIFLVVQDSSIGDLVTQSVREGLNGKKNVFFRALPE